MGSHSEQPAVLVTGLDGFTGRHLESALRAAGFHVVDLECDIRDSNAVSERVFTIEPAVVIHLAGIAFVAHADINEIYHVNVIGSRNLFSALSRLPKPPSNVIVASSATVYGNTPESPITEAAPLRPHNDYAVSKVTVEHLIRMYGDLLPYTIVRPFNYTGPGQSLAFVVPKIVDHARRRESIIELGNTHVVREYGDVRRAVEAYVRLCSRAGNGETYNIATGTGVTLNEVVTSCTRITGCPMEIRTNPKFVRPNEVDVLIGDGSKLEAYLGPLPQFHIQDTVRWMLAEEP